jgi:hypothetical protein
VVAGSSDKLRNADNVVERHGMVETQIELKNSLVAALLWGRLKKELFPKIEQYVSSALKGYPVASRQTQSFVLGDPNAEVQIDVSITIKAKE